MRGNPWGKLVENTSALTAALNNTPHETLVELLHGHDHTKTLEQLAAMPDTQLRSMVDFAEMHIREKGPVAFGGYFFGITGFHGFHVFSGVIINIIMLIMTQKDVFARKGHYLMIEKAGLYWHFVDLVWVFVFLCFYLIYSKRTWINLLFSLWNNIHARSISPRSCIIRTSTKFHLK